MHNLIVMGCARSGTSMIAGTLATAGYCTIPELFVCSEIQHRLSKAWPSIAASETI
ncbi:MAG: hypothetical protein AAF639_08165 [Chloroflexota bacterium]